MKLVDDVLDGHIGERRRGEGTRHKGAHCTARRSGMAWGVDGVAVDRASKGAP